MKIQTGHERTDHYPGCLCVTGLLPKAPRRVYIRVPGRHRGAIRALSDRLYWNPEIVTEMLYELLRAYERWAHGLPASAQNRVATISSTDIQEYATPSAAVVPRQRLMQASKADDELGTCPSHHLSVGAPKMVKVIAH